MPRAISWRIPDRRRRQHRRRRLHHRDLREHGERQRYRDHRGRFDHLGPDREPAVERNGDRRCRSPVPDDDALCERPWGGRRLTLSWRPSDTTANLWTLAVQGHDGTDYGTVEVEFHDPGATPGAPLSYTGTADPGLVAPAAFAVAADGTMTLTVNNGTTPQTLAISLGAPGTYAGVTQFAGTSPRSASTSTGARRPPSPAPSSTTTGPSGASTRTVSVGPSTRSP